MIVGGSTLMVLLPTLLVVTWKIVLESLHFVIPDTPSPVNADSVVIEWNVTNGVPNPLSYRQVCLE